MIIGRHHAQGATGNQQAVERDLGISPASDGYHVTHRQGRTVLIRSAQFEPLAGIDHDRERFAVASIVADLYDPASTPRVQSGLHRLGCTDLAHRLEQGIK